MRKQTCMIYSNTAMGAKMHISVFFWELILCLSLSFSPAELDDSRCHTQIVQ